MNMVGTADASFNSALFMSGKLVKNFTQPAAQLTVEHFLTVFRYKYNVIHFVCDKLW